MLARIWRERKKIGILIGCIAAVILLAIYVRAMFRPGLWHDGAFLFRKEDGSLAFHGTINTIGDWYVLEDENWNWLNMIEVRAQYVTPEPEELFPNLTQIYNWVHMEKAEIHGNPEMLLGVLLLSALLAVDIIFPDFFFQLSCGLWVEGGRPTEWYRAGQIIRRGLAGLGIFFCLLSSFTGH